MDTVMGAKEYFSALDLERGISANWHYREHIKARDRRIWMEQEKDRLASDQRPLNVNSPKLKSNRHGNDGNKLVINYIPEQPGNEIMPFYHATTEPHEYIGVDPDSIGTCLGDVFKEANVDQLFAFYRRSAENILGNAYKRVVGNVENSEQLFEKLYALGPKGEDIVNKILLVKDASLQCDASQLEKDPELSRDLTLQACPFDMLVIKDYGGLTEH